MIMKYKENMYRVENADVLKHRDLSALKDATFVYEDARGMVIHAKYLKNLKQGEYFTLSPASIDDEVKERKVYVKDTYDRSTKKYSIYKFSDICAEQFKKGNTVVFVDFIF